MILNRVQVNINGRKNALNMIARLSASSSNQLMIEPYDKSNTDIIMTSIRLHDSSMNPSVDSG